MHDPVYPVLNDRLRYYKNWMTDEYTLSAFSSIWPFKAVVNQDNIDEPLSERIHELFGSRTSRLLCVDPRLSELITANVICKSGDELSILNESLTFDLAFQKCHEDNSTFRELEIFSKIFKDFIKSSDTPTMDELNALDGEILDKLGVTSESRYNSRLIRGLFDESIFIWTEFVRINITHFKVRFVIYFNP